MSERDLWSAVLLRAVEDALYAPNTGAGKVSRILDAAAARSYLTKPSQAKQRFGDDLRYRRYRYDCAH